MQLRQASNCANQSTAGVVVIAPRFYLTGVADELHRFRVWKLRGEVGKGAMGRDVSELVK